MDTHRRRRRAAWPSPLLLHLLLLLASATAVAAAQHQQPPEQQQQHAPLARSILYVVVDDLTADLAVFGGRIDQASTPNFERLARRSTFFRRAYAQEAVCGPSRNSFLTGRYPDELRVYTFMRSFRDDWPDAVSLPQAFKEQGFLTCGFGKIFHDDVVLSPPDYDQPYSWSPECPYYAPPEDFCAPNAHGWCSPDMPEANFTDARGVDAAIARLRGHVAGANDSRPFFWAVGIRKPHLDWAVPRAFLDRQVAQEDIALPPRDQRLAPYGQPPVAWWNCSHEGDWPKLPPLSPVDPLPDALTQELRRGYLSAVSWADHQLGKLLDALDALGLSSTTAVVLHADHGFHLGDSGEWCKMTTAEVGTRVPLLVALPPATAAAQTEGAMGTGREEIVELVDVYPTLLDVAGLPLPDPSLRGRSLRPLLTGDGGTTSHSTGTMQVGGDDDNNDNDEELRRLLAALPAGAAAAHELLAHGVAFSQFPRCRSPRATAPSPLAAAGYEWNGQCVMYGNAHIAAMGYAVRVHGWRYAEWYAYDPFTWLPRWNATDGLLGAELYAMDGRGEDGNGGRERNVAGEEPAVARVLGYLLRRHFWPLLRPRRAGERASGVSPAVAATRWADPAPPGRGDAMGVEDDELREAWGELFWRGDDEPPVASVTAAALRRRV